MIKFASIFYLCLSFLLVPILKGQKHINVPNLKQQIPIIVVSEATAYDSIRISDSLRFQTMPETYEKLKTESKKYKWTTQLYRIIVKEPRVNVSRDLEIKSIEDYDPYRDKIIRNINIIVDPPFRAGDNTILKFFDDSHIRTKSSTIYSIIQFKKGNRVNPALIMASEADLRQSRFISSASITINSIANCTDSVDVTILVRDKWTIGMDLHNLSLSKTAFEIYNANIFGSGGRAGVDFLYSDNFKKEFGSDWKFGYGLSYQYRNIANTGIELEGRYRDKINSINLELKASRPLQPKYRYFGEASYTRYTVRPELTYWDSISPDKHEKLSLALGRTFNYSMYNYVNQLVISFRFKSNTASYNYLPYAEYIADHQKAFMYQNYKMFLAQVSLYKNSYRQEYLIFNIGSTEDIALGYNISTQFGYTTSPIYKNALYSSFAISVGISSRNGGSLYLKNAIGNYFNKHGSFGGLLKMDTKYISPLKEIWSFYFRQFLIINYSKYLQPYKYFEDYIYMGAYTTLKMPYWQRDLKGDQMLFIQTETNAFAPFQSAGFRFTFFSFFDFGWLSQKSTLIKERNFNYGLGLGVRLRNNFIVFNTINIKLGYYPKMIQENISNYLIFTSSDPQTYPNFVPGIPNEITP